MDFKRLLNDRQYEAVSTSSQYVRVVAGAGSGKTRVLTYRIAYLVAELNVDPRSILAITFTNKAAGEMADRAARLVKDVLGYLPSLHISTFHSFCARFLRQEADAIGFPKAFTIYDEEDKNKLIKNIAVEMGYKKGDSFVKEASRYIDKYKTKGQYPEDITIKYERYPNEKKHLEFYTRYEKKKDESYAMDFDDLLLKTIKILEMDERVREKWAYRFDHILVDEFQDTNDVQYKLMSLLLRRDSCLYVVGDPDQTIYTWRGANQNLILNYESTYSNVETIILNENYRSTKKILDCANKLIGNNKKRVPKDLFTNSDLGDDVVGNNLPKADDEASWVARKVSELARRHRDSNGTPVFSNIAVLYRSSYMTRPFELAFKDNQVPYKIYGGVRFYERMEVKDLLSYFNLMVNPKDNVAFERIINVPKRSIGETSVDRIREEASRENLSEYEYMQNIAAFSDVTTLSKRVITQCSLFIDKMEATKAKLSDNLEAYSGILKDFVTDLGYFEYLKSDEDPDEDRIKNVEELFNDISHFIEKNPESTFEEYLQNITLLTSQDDISGGNFVSLMTIHVAKGLEFDNVFIIGMNQGAFPSDRSISESGRDGDEEERRLAYVAMTRARKRLFCTCNEGYSYITDSRQTPSQFFKEAGIGLPRSNYFDSHHLWTSKGSGSYFKPPANKSTTSFFADGDAIDPFKQEEKKTAPVKQTNGISNWKVGDLVDHQKFGRGKVIEVINDKIIKISFDTEGIKTLLGSHPMLDKAKSEGGDA